LRLIVLATSSFSRRSATSAVYAASACAGALAVAFTHLARMALRAIRVALPHGMGVARLTDLPAEWSRQREMLGFPSH
jgi:hypothetical protein